MSATAVEVDPGTQIRSIPEPVAGDANMWATATHADAVVTVAAPAAGSNKRILIERVDWSYSGTPAGRLTVAYGATVIFDIDITAAGANRVDVYRTVPVETAAVVTLVDGGVGVVGKVNVVARMIQ